MSRTLAHLFDLTGKTAVITGGAQPAGLQVARALGEAGARIMLCDADADALEDAAATLQDAGIDTRWVAANCALPADLHKLVNETLHRMGDIDILVNSAVGWRLPQPLPAQAPGPLQAADTWEPLMALAVRGPLLLSQWVAQRSMIGRGGRIIYLAPRVAPTHGPHGHVACVADLAGTACCGALLACTRALAGEWAAHGITVNAIGPGLDQAQHGPGDDGDLCGISLLLASEAGRHITGQWLALDGATSPGAGS